MLKVFYALPASCLVRALIMGSACGGGGGDSSGSSGGTLTVTQRTSPGVPTIGTATAGNGRATVAFTAPSSDGGAAVSAHTASCTGGGATCTANGASNPITVTGQHPALVEKEIL